MQVPRLIPEPPTAQEHGLGLQESVKVLAVSIYSTFPQRAG